MNDKETVFNNAQTIPKAWFFEKIHLIESNYRTLNLILSAKLFLSYGDCFG